MERQNYKTTVDIFTDYFNNPVHEDECGELVKKLRPLFEEDKHIFAVVVFSLCTRMGIERPDFAMEMTMSWLRGRGYDLKLEQEMPEGFEGGGEFKES